MQGPRPVDGVADDEPGLAERGQLVSGAGTGDVHLGDRAEAAQGWAVGSEGRAGWAESTTARGRRVRAV